jgi:hypothetical protein
MFNLNLEDCILVKNEFYRLLEERNKNEVLRVSKNSKNIFSKIYANRSIAINEKPQFFLYADDIVLLDNCEDFRKTNFVFMVHRQAKIEFESLVNKKQFGEYIVISMKEAKALIKRAKLNSFCD